MPIWLSIAAKQEIKVAVHSKIIIIIKIEFRFTFKTVLSSKEMKINAVLT